MDTPSGPYLKENCIGGNAKKLQQDGLHSAERVARQARHGGTGAVLDALENAEATAEKKGRPDILFFQSIL